MAASQVLYDELGNVEFVFGWTMVSTWILFINIRDYLTTKLGHNSQKEGRAITSQTTEESSPQNSRYLRSKSEPLLISKPSRGLCHY